MIAYAMGFQLFSYFCSRHAPQPSSLASHLTRVCLFVSKCLFSIICVIAFFICWNNFVCSLFQSLCYFLLFLCVIIVGVRGLSVVTGLGLIFVICLFYLITDLSCFCFFMIASVLRVVGMIPSGLILYPSHVISVTANSHLWKLTARFSLSNLFNTLSNSHSWILSDHFVMIIISSRNACAQWIFASVKSIIFWNVAGLSVNP